MLNVIQTQKVARDPHGIAPRISVKVTRTNIQNAKPNCPSACAVALGLLEQGYAAPRVGLTGDGYLAVTKNGERWVYRGLAKDIVAATYAVDAGHKDAIKPFTIRLNHGLRYAMTPYVRIRDAGGTRRGKRTTVRPDKGGSVGRTLRREKLQCALKAVGGVK